MSIKSIQEQIVHLSTEERLRLIDLLWESLDEEECVKETETKRAVGSEERIDAVECDESANNVCASDGRIAENSSR